MISSLALFFLTVFPPTLAPPPGADGAPFLVAPTAERGPPVIDRVEVRIGNVFDPSRPEEDRLLFRLANRFHRITREEVVRRQLLFHPGEPLDHQRLEESERLLRRSSYLYEPRIHATTDGDGTAVVEVEARDVWTLNAGIHFSHKGGENRSSVEISDSNFLGLGKEVTLRRTFEVERNSWLLRYFDPRWLGSRNQVGVAFEERSDGRLLQLEARRPFLYLDDRRSWGVLALDESRDDFRYFRGIEVDRFQHQRRAVEIEGGFSRGLEGDRTRRLTFGWSWSEDRFGAPAPVLGDLGTDDPTLDAAPDFVGAPGTPELPAPEDRTLSWLWVSWQTVANDFERTRNLDKIGRTEDRNLGLRLRLRAGASLAVLGATRDELVFDLDLARAAEPSETLLLEGLGHLEGRYGVGGGGDGGTAGGLANLRLGIEGRLYRRSADGRRVFFVRGLADFVVDPDPETQLLLGGDSGLRGYPARYQDGDRRFLLTVEERFFTHWTLLELADVGAAVFADVGRSWRPGGADDPGAGYLTDVGVGLRLGNKRSGNGSVIHLDLAMPLTGGQDIAGLQWLVSTRQAF